MHWEVFVIVGSSLFVSAVAIPMTLDKIPPNTLYGFRTARTLSDDKIWYPANRAAGRALTLAGLVSAVAARLAVWTCDMSAPSSCSDSTFCI